MEKAESKLSIARVPKTEETTCIGKCLLCHLPKSDETIEGMIRFVTYPPNHTTDSGAQVLCANTIAPLIMSANNTTDYEIINKADLKNKYGTGSNVLYALSRCRSLFSRVGKEWNESNSDQKEYFLVKEVERHLKLVQDPRSRTDNQDFTSASNQTVRKASNLSPRTKLNDKPHKIKAEVNTDSDKDLLQNVFNRIHSPSLPSILNFVLSPENNPQTQQHQISHDINSFGKSEKLLSGSKLNDQSHENNLKTNSDTDSLRKILNCVPSPENGSQTQEHQSSHKIYSFERSRQLESDPELINQSNEKHPKIDSDDVAGLSNVLNNVSSPANGSKTKERKSSYNMDSPGSKYQSLWDQKYKELVKYVEDFGHSRVPVQYSLLGGWVRHQRANYKVFQKGNSSTRMTEKRIELLNQIGFEWDSQVHSWETSYEQLVEFATINGHTRIPQKFPPNPCLAYWVHAQRLNYKNFQKGDLSSRMTGKRVELLKKIGFEWNLTGPPWERTYYDLVQFVKENGHSRVPRRYPKNPTLGDWASRQRQYYKQIQKGTSSSNLTEDRIELLNKIGFDWDSVKLKRSQHQWDERYKELVCYVEKRGNTRVPRDVNPSLSNWTVRQRQDFRLLQKGDPTKMTEDRVHLLDKIGFEWECLAQPLKRKYAEL